MKTELKCKSRNLSSSFQLCCSLALLQKSRNPSELLSSVKLRYWVKRFPRSFPASEVFDGQCWQMKPMIPRAEDPGETIWPCLPALKQDPWEESNQAEQREHSSFFSVFFFFFWMWTILKVFIEFVSILLLFIFWFFGYEACGVLAPWPGMEPTPPALEGKVLNSRVPPGTSQEVPSSACFELQGPSRDLPGSPELSLFWWPLIHSLSSHWECSSPLDHHPEHPVTSVPLFPFCRWKSQY